MMKTLQLFNVDKDEIGVLTIHKTGEISIDLNQKYLHMEKDLQELGHKIFEKDHLPLKTARKNGSKVVYSVENIHKTDDRYAQAVTEFINNFRAITPRVFAVYTANKEGK